MTDASRRIADASFWSIRRRRRKARTRDQRGEKRTEDAIDIVPICVIYVRKALGDLFR